MADDVDLVTEHSELLLQAAIKRATSRPEISPNKSGLCRSCGEPINPRRLEINPAARLCIDCAT